ncbi:MAG: response regulator transcription factor [Bacteroidetes bacterium]|nr:response regulator transcription factor [Bacteroidota bacterium]
MLRAIVIDDEQKGINSIKLLVEKFVKDVRIVAESIEAEKGISLIEDYKPEIVFLDINMPHMNGFELLQQLKFKEFSLIFTTAHTEYALQAIKNNALDYLLKPINHEDLIAAVERVKKKTKQETLPDLGKLLEELSSPNKGKIPLHVKDKVEYVNKNDIIRLESDSNYTNVFTTGGKKLMISKTLGDYETLLCNKENTFMRVHQSHIINLNYVVKFTKDNGGFIITKDNCSVPLSKNKKDEFLTWLDVK